MKHLDQAIAHLNTFTKSHNIYNSEERELILRCIDSLNTHFTSAQLLEYISKEKNISKATVYNNIKLFLQAGLIIKHPFGEKDYEYEATWRAYNHHHRICIECGAIKEFTDKKIQTPIKNRHFNAFEKTYSCVYLYGICKKCAKIAKK